MTSTKTISLDFGIPDVEATITFEDEPPREPAGCPMCAEVAASEPTRMTMCSRCGDDAADCATCTPPPPKPPHVGRARWVAHACHHPSLGGGGL